MRFVHQLLQEYFAAFKMQDDLRNGVSARKYWPEEQWWKPTGWEETAIILAGLEGDATPVVRWLTPVHPILAYQVSIESGAPCDSSALQTMRELTPNARLAPAARAEWWRSAALWKIRSRSGSFGWCKRDFITKLLEAVDVMLLDAGFIQLVAIVAAQVLLCRAITKHIVDNPQHAVCRRQRRSFASPPLC